MKKIMLNIIMLGLVGLVNAQSLKISAGTFEIKEANLSFNGKKIVISEDVMSVSLVNSYKVKDTDVILISQSTGGNACPATYFFVTVEKQLAKKSAVFGTCSDFIKLKQVGSSLIATMPTMNSKGISKYVYDAGLLTENGKLLK